MWGYRRNFGFAVALAQTDYDSTKGSSTTRRFLGCWQVGCCFLLSVSSRIIHRVGLAFDRSCKVSSFLQGFAHFQHKQGTELVDNVWTFLIFSVCSHLFDTINLKACHQLERSDINQAQGLGNKEDPTRDGKTTSTHTWNQPEPNMVLAEVGAHTGARMCNTMQEFAGTKNAIKLGGTGNHLTDTTPRRLLAKTLEQEKLRHQRLSPRCGS